jgi:ABC-type antimicrobial peptide transport system permease subunit
MTEYPYMVSNNKILPIINGLQAAAKPPKFTLEFLRNIGFTSTNDRAIVPLFRKLGFLSEDGVPTAYYDQLRDKTTFKRILAARIKELYSELFTINTQIYNDSEQNIKGAISRVTGSDETGVTRVFNTFKALCSIADFSNEIKPAVESPVLPTPEIAPDDTTPKRISNLDCPEFHYNIQIHLPATTDISVYNAIFKSLKDNLLI